MKRSLKQLMKQFFMKPSIHDELFSVFCMEYKMKGRKNRSTHMGFINFINFLKKLI